MITGDYPETAKSIAKQIGLTNNNAILTGDEISQMNEVELSQKIKNVSIFWIIRNIAF
jgi:Ca2+-transporting ATPase